MNHFETKNQKNLPQRVHHPHTIPPRHLNLATPQTTIRGSVPTHKMKWLIVLLKHKKLHCLCEELNNNVCAAVCVYCHIPGTLCNAITSATRKVNGYIVVAVLFINWMCTSGHTQHTNRFLHINQFSIFPSIQQRQLIFIPVSKIASKVNEHLYSPQLRRQ